MDRLQKVWRFKTHNRQDIFLFIWNPWEPAADYGLARESQWLGSAFSFLLWARLERGFGGVERSDDVSPASGDVGWNPADVGRNRAGSNRWEDRRKFRKGLISPSHRCKPFGTSRMAPALAILCKWAKELDSPIYPMEMTQSVQWRWPLLCRCGHQAHTMLIFQHHFKSISCWVAPSMKILNMGR